MNKQQVIKKTSEYVKKELKNESSGHDWWHIERVRKMSRRIAKTEGGNLFVIELGALLHDIADWKFNKDDVTKSGKVARTWLKNLGVKDSVVNEVVHIADNIYWKEKLCKTLTDWMHWAQ